MKTRFLGVVLLLTCVVAIGHLYVLVHTGPLHQPTVDELLTALIAVLSGLPGALLLLVGQALFEPDVWPPRR